MISNKLIIVCFVVVAAACGSNGATAPPANNSTGGTAGQPGSGGGTPASGGVSGSGGDATDAGGGSGDADYTDDTAVGLADGGADISIVVPPADTGLGNTGPTNPVATDPGLVLSMTRTLCLGWCPAYSVAVYDDGRLAYEGDYYVKTIGKGEGRVDRATIDSIEREAESAGLTALTADCCDCKDVTDSPTVSISYDFGAGERGAIEHYLGCRKAPEWLATFENRIDELLETDQFIGTADERQKLFGPPQ